MKEYDLLIIMCPPLADYPEAPKDQSHSELCDCPRCGEKMWLSEKKNNLLSSCPAKETELLILCYRCLTYMAKKDPSFMDAYKQEFIYL